MNLMIKKLFQNYRFIGVLWFGLSFVAVLQTAFRPEKYNNYLIFKGVFWYTIQQLPLYVPLGRLSAGIFALHGTSSFCRTDQIYNEKNASFGFGGSDGF